MLHTFSLQSSSKCTDGCKMTSVRDGFRGGDSSTSLSGGPRLVFATMAYSLSRHELHVFYMLLVHLVTSPALASSFHIELFVPSARALWDCTHRQLGWRRTSALGLYR